MLAVPELAFRGFPSLCVVVAMIQKTPDRPSMHQKSLRDHPTAGRCSVESVLFPDHKPAHPKRCFPIHTRPFSACPTPPLERFTSSQTTDDRAPIPGSPASSFPPRPISYPHLYHTQNKSTILPNLTHCFTRHAPRARSRNKTYIRFSFFIFRFTAYPRKRFCWLARTISLISVMARSDSAVASPSQITTRRARA